VIRNFGDEEAERIWNGERSRKLPSDIQKTARRKLRMINRALKPHDLRVPRNNRFEELKGKRKGTYSVRINDQWRICFRWAEGEAADVRIEDYHRG
jgi:proteic killer suppression protein